MGGEGGRRTQTTVPVIAEHYLGDPFLLHSRCTFWTTHPGTKCRTCAQHGSCRNDSRNR
jgi:hypothetical protein